ncbi:MAG TPA: thiamine pyrophosphate-dependent enzyme, partial [Gaiellaceae bacterium]|nr:thiamine pyrophosphate-dependent enzyme [Gaiellaceae bacterium]
FRARFHHDVVVDLVGYRRFGHNEGDEPSYTQPRMYEAIERQPPVREQYAERLAERGIVSVEDAERVVEQVQQRMRDAHEALKASIAAGGARAPSKERRPGRAGDAQIETAVPAERLRELNEHLLAVPDGFHVNPKLAKQLERRREALGEGGLDWAHAEALALAALAAEGVPVRLTGQDTVRGTFSQRHLALHDAETGQTWTGIQHLPDARASIELHNSPLSELACLGFEYGYAMAAPEALVLWEAQFGDFINAAQVIVDQFIVAGLAKWGRTSRLTLLLPHGYEGSGPEHSSARLERFMQLAAQENIRIANCTTAGQYFHLLRRQALAPRARPLVVFTPKGLLRLKQAASRMEDLTAGRFKPILDDPTVEADERPDVRRLVLCSGKVYYDIVGHPACGAGASDAVAVARLEQLYPFPVAAYDELLARYPNVEQVVWTQEEPQNMGPWRAIRHRLEEGLPEEIELRYCGRPWRASPSEGYPTAHLLEQERIVTEALGARG